MIGCKIMQVCIGVFDKSVQRGINRFENKWAGSENKNNKLKTNMGNLKISY
jgi:hypothetical protein